MPFSAPSDFIGLKLCNDLGAVSVEKVVDDEHDDRAVFCARVEPGSYERGAEFHEHGASAYELYVICTRSGEVLDVNHRVQHCPCGSRSFAPQGAPVHMLPADAMFDLDWEDIAVSAQTYFLDVLRAMTAGSPPATPKPRQGSPRSRQKGKSRA